MSTNTALDQIKKRAEGHTEGPWEADHTDPGVWSQEHIVVGQYTANDGFDSQMWEDGTKADRELLAAAPKLLAALEAVQAKHVPDAETGKCEECTYARYSMFSVSFPCPTIKAIEEALR